MAGVALFQFGGRLVHVALARDARAPVVHPVRGVLLDGRPLQRLDRVRERVGVDIGVEGHRGAVALGGVVFLHAFDHVVGGEAEALDLDRAVGKRVDVGLEAVGVDPPSTRLLDLDHERSPGAEHERVDILAARAVERRLRSVHHVLDDRHGVLLDAVVVEVAGAATVVAGVRTLPSRPLTLSAGPLRLRDVALQLLISAVDERRVHLRVDLVFREVDRELDVRAVEGDLGVGDPADPLADLAVELRFERLARVLVETGVRAEQRLVLLDQRRRACADVVRGELDALDRRGCAFGPLVELGTAPLTDPTLRRFDRLVVLVVAQRERHPQRRAAVGVRQPEAPVGDEPAETGVAHRAGVGRARRDVEYVHTPSSGPRGNCLTTRSVELTLGRWRASARSPGLPVGSFNVARTASRIVQCRPDCQSDRSMSPGRRTSYGNATRSARGAGRRGRRPALRGVPRLDHLAQLLEPAGAAHRGDPLGAVYRRAREQGVRRLIRDVRDARRVRERIAGGARGGDQLDHLLQQQGEVHPLGVRGHRGEARRRGAGHHVGADRPDGRRAQDGERRPPARPRRRRGHRRRHARPADHAAARNYGGRAAGGDRTGPVGHRPRKRLAAVHAPHDRPRTRDVYRDQPRLCGLRARRRLPLGEGRRRRGLGERRGVVGGARRRESLAQGASEADDVRQ
ncbi:hypothetical protein BN903_230 [Halorubrum sp. AJ67]|nr:hypothetical protein BN903_230 [Halorubrum sp. AJ67]